MKEIGRKCVAAGSAILADIETTKGHIRKQDEYSTLVGLVEIGGHIGTLDLCGVMIDKSHLLTAALNISKKRWDEAERNLEDFKNTVKGTLAAL